MFVLREKKSYACIKKWSTYFVVSRKIQNQKHKSNLIFFLSHHNFSKCFFFQIQIVEKQQSRGCWCEFIKQGIVALRLQGPRSRGEGVPLCVVRRDQQAGLLWKQISITELRLWRHLVIGTTHISSTYRWGALIDRFWGM